MHLFIFCLVLSVYHSPTFWFPANYHDIVISIRRLPSSELSAHVLFLSTSFICYHITIADLLSALGRYHQLDSKVTRSLNSHATSIKIRILKQLVSNSSKFIRDVPLTFHCVVVGQQQLHASVSIQGWSIDLPAIIEINPTLPTPEMIQILQS